MISCAEASLHWLTTDTVQINCKCNLNCTVPYSASLPSVANPHFVCSCIFPLHMKSLT
eukprot:NODE_2235_length_379_cov_61.242063_g2225_i0.p2 GENE.NODE_2235_length_379_cov_61.242063_g2225_i0~~NODE_2235_length_379_cov_61.242063_g2225_i0.p2  ORF type:complete len:58 (-),score=0.69 NODE_2235_length_379_cov_61.242063_g2225_i0:110-283(-)